MAGAACRQDGSGDNCRADQPQAWIPHADHAPSIWTDLDTVDPWPFADIRRRDGVS